MVAFIVRQVWRCPECHEEWADEHTPRAAQVFHIHAGREVRMVWQREEAA